MIINGRKIADEIKFKIKQQVLSLDKKPILAILQVGDDMASLKFVAQKKNFADFVGVQMMIKNLPSNVSQIELVQEIHNLNKDKAVSGIVLQLPLPQGLNPQIFLSAISPQKDPDALSDNPKVIAPVVGAIQEIFLRNDVQIHNAKVTIVGQGRLVGIPVAKWLCAKGAIVTILNKQSFGIISDLRDADIVISGVGVPRLIVPEMVRQGAILIDVGTSTTNGTLVGDIDPRSAQKAKLFTPVPGGVGPITVAKLFENLLCLIVDIQ